MSIYGPILTTPNIVLSVTYYLELRNAITIYCISFFLGQQRSNWLFEHYVTLTSLLGNKLH